MPVSPAPASIRTPFFPATPTTISDTRAWRATARRPTSSPAWAGTARKLPSENWSPLRVPIHHRPVPLRQLLSQLRLPVRCRDPTAASHRVPRCHHGPAIQVPFRHRHRQPGHPHPGGLIWSAAARRCFAVSASRIHSHQYRSPLRARPFLFFFNVALTFVPAFSDRAGFVACHRPSPTCSHSRTMVET
jgi:hypothetical protein